MHSSPKNAWVMIEQMREAARGEVFRGKSAKLGSSINVLDRNNDPIQDCNFNQVLDRPSLRSFSIMAMLRLILIATAAVTMSATATAQVEPEQVVAALRPAATVKGSPSLFMPLVERMQHYNVPAVSIAVIEDDEIEWARTYGVRSAASETPATADTLFQAASISKPVTASAILKLAYERDLSLDESVNHYLTSWHIPDSVHTQDNPITLRHLLSHSSGLSVHGFLGYAQGEEVPTLKQVLNGTKPANSAAVLSAQDPGEFRYSGGGTLVVQQLIEDLTGCSFEETMRNLVLRPLEMDNSSFEQPLSNELAQKAASGHRAHGEPIEGAWHTYPEQAAAGLWTTGEDLARFTAWVLRGLRDDGTTPAHRFVAQHLVERQPGLIPIVEEHMGLGLFLAGDGEQRHFSHLGTNEGFRAFLIGFPETGQGAVVLTNGDGGGALIPEIIRAVAAKYEWPESFHEVITPVKPATEILEAHAGTYLMGPEANLEVTFSLKEGSLEFAGPFGSYPKLIAVSQNDYLDTMSGMKFSFDGERVSLIFPNGPTLVGIRKPS